MVRLRALYGDHAALLGAPGRRAAGDDPDRVPGCTRCRRRVPRPPARAVRRQAEHHHVRAVLARAGGDDQADGDRGDLPRRLGDVGEGLDHRGPGLRPRQLPALPGAGRSGRDRARVAHRRSQPAVPAAAHEREAARRDAGNRLSAVHHRRRRHRPRRRPARAQPHPPLRRGRRPRLPHRGPAPGHQEVRPPGRQGAGALGRADQAAQHRALPARRHGRAGDHRRPHRRRGGQPARIARRRARPAVHPRLHQRKHAHLQGGVPRPDAALLHSRGPGDQRPPALRHLRRRARRRRRLARAHGPRGARRHRPPRRTSSSRLPAPTPCSTRSRRSSSRRGRPRPASRPTPTRSPR